MNVSLTPELEKFVASKVDSGRYNSASEVVREALRLLEEHERSRAAHLAELIRNSDAAWPPSTAANRLPPLCPATGWLENPNSAESRDDRLRPQHRRGRCEA